MRQAVAALKARGYHVTLYPFLLMDIAPGNGLPDLYGGVEQAAFPWRGRITVIAGDIAAQVETFFERYRSFVLHYADVAQQTGADGILIGSELIGLTHAEDGGAYHAVEALRMLAHDVRTIVGAGVEISYAADWTEYGARVADGNVTFPLDALWADDAIDYVGLDWYPPMADWRDASDHADVGFRDGRSRAYLGSNIAGGEAFDWFYTDETGRVAQERVVITDEACGEAWVFRQKDVANWWANTHHPRAGAIRSPTSTAWTAGMKPVRFVEMGCPAVDKGANQPNVFYDPKSSESGLPHFSDGSRDDVIQRRAIEAFHAHWAIEANNPTSAEYDGRMIPQDGVGLWAWDARPFPAFPARDDAWGDAGNWRLGHWLNGRVGLALLADVVGDVCGRAGGSIDVSELAGIVSGYRFDGPISTRAVLEPLMAIHGLDATERDGTIVFRMRGAGSIELDRGRLVDAEDAPAPATTREGMERGETRIRLRFVDAEADHGPGTVMSDGAAAADAVEMEMAIALDRAQAQRCVNMLAEQLVLQGDRVRFAMSADGSMFEAGDVVTLEGQAWWIVEVQDEKVVAFEAVRAGVPSEAVLTPATPVSPAAPSAPVEPDVVIVDGPPLPAQEDDLRPIGFAFAEPWVGPVKFSAGADPTMLSERGRVERPCAMGRLVSGLYPHVSGRWQETSVWVSVAGGALSSRNEAAVLNGANIAMVETDAGWEMLQFLQAELVDIETYKLTGLLRGQQGSEDATAAGAPTGSRIVFLTGAEQRLDLAGWERGLELQWRAGRESVGDVAAWSGNFTHSGMAGRSWSPSHLKADWHNGDLSLTWVRRARKEGDPWLAGEPGHEWPEGYQVRVSGGVSAREWDIAETVTVYSAGDQATDFPAGGTALIEVAQLGANGEPGGWTGVELTIPAP